MASVGRAVGHGKRGGILELGPLTGMWEANVRQLSEEGYTVVINVGANCRAILVDGARIDLLTSRYAVIEGWLKVIITPNQYLTVL